MQNSKEKTLSQRIADRIIKYILEENLQPGDKLPNETVMCERLNVGRSSLREAMRALAIPLISDSKEYTLRDETIETHREIADAIAAHDAVRAHDAMYLHLIYNRKHIKSTN